ncbi:hypothetical protein [Dokdonella immobilis]|uniref:hypothetical protein n=1 Tax=Dokdonella immobilis TaxID=578942 RepID=UPI001587B785|nr:hypothetical protein [Dokdonella immobilis]
MRRIDSTGRAHGRHSTRQKLDIAGDMDVDGDFPDANLDARSFDVYTLIRTEDDLRRSCEPGTGQAEPRRLPGRNGIGRNLDNRGTSGDPQYGGSHEGLRCGLGNEAVDAQWHGNERTAFEQGTGRNMQLVGRSWQIAGYAALANDLDQSIDKRGIRADGNGHQDERSFVVRDWRAAQLDALRGGQAYLRLLGETVDAGWRQAAQVGASYLEQIAVAPCKKVGRHAVDLGHRRRQEDLGRVRAIIRQRVSALIENAESTQTGSGRSSYVENRIDTFTRGVNLKFHDSGVVRRIEHELLHSPKSTTMDHEALATLANGQAIWLEPKDHLPPGHAQQA